jgi:hypothetical protein
MTQEEANAYMVHSLERQIKQKGERLKSLEIVYSHDPDHMQAQLFKEEAAMLRQEIEELKEPLRSRSNR